jgi:hypothetical protein
MTRLECPSKKMENHAKGRYSPAECTGAIKTPITAGGNPHDLHGVAEDVSGASLALAAR